MNADQEKEIAKKLQNIFGFMAMPDTKILQDTEVIVDRKTGKKAKVKYGVEVLNTHSVSVTKHMQNISSG